MQAEWNFDSGSLQGARVDSGSYAQQPAVALAPEYMGGKSWGMAIPVEFTASGDAFITRFRVCRGSSTSNLRSKTFSVRIYLETLNAAATTPFIAQLHTERQNLPIAETSYSAGAWFILEGSFPQGEDPNVNEVWLTLGSFLNPKWSGRVWIDDLQIR
jgi:hypothetical protein